MDCSVGGVRVASVFEWRSELSELHARLGELFVRAEPRRQAGLYLEGLLSAVERKNGWQLAEPPSATAILPSPCAHPIRQK